MATNYKIESATTSGSGGLSIPIGWEINNPQTDITVFAVSPAGVVSECDWWTWDGDNGNVDIPNTQGWTGWSAFVCRAEAAEMLEQLTSEGTIAVADIIAQLQKNVRILEQLQEAQKTAICCPDYADGLIPPAAGRAGKFLSFDDNGKPACDIGIDDINYIKTKLMEISSAAETAVSAKNAAQTAQGKAEAAATSAEGAKSAVNSDALKAEGYAVGTQDGTDVASDSPYHNNNAKYYKEQAESSASAASGSASTASNKALEAEGYAVGKQNGADVSSDSPYYNNNAKHFEEAAANSATDASTYAGHAEDSALAAEGYAVGEQNGAPVSSGAYYLNNAKYFAQQAANSSTAASDSAESAAASAETAATLLVNATELGQTKANAGALRFVGGTLTTASFSATAPLSICATVNPGFAGSLTLSNLTCAIASGGALTLSDGTNSLTATLFANSNPSSVVISLTAAGSAKIYVNGLLAATGTLNLASASSALVATGTGAMSRIKAFNFDMGDASALYSVAAYHAGIDEPAACCNGAYYGNSSLTIGTDLTLGSGVVGNFVNSTTDLPEGATSKVVFGTTGVIGSFTIRSLTCAYIPTANIDLSSFAGKAMQIELSCLLKRNYNLDLGGANTSQGFVVKWGDSNLIRLNSDTCVQELPTQDWYKKTWVINEPLKASSYSGNVIYFTGHITSQGTGPTDAFEMANLTVKVNGALVSLPNYTVKNGGTRTILDASGNANDATVSGVLAGDNDAKIGRLIDFIVAQNS